MAVDRATLGGGIEADMGGLQQLPDVGVGPDAEVQIRILGSLEVAVGSARVDLGGPKQRALFTVLALHAGEVVPNDRLVDQLWGERPPRTATHSIQIYVSGLRRCLAAKTDVSLIVTQAPGYMLAASPETIDSHRFEVLVRRGLAAGGADKAERIEALNAALGLWRGDPLSDYAFEDFAQPQITHLRELHLQAIEELSRAHLSQGDHAEAVRQASAAVHTDPLRERPRELLMLALYGSGRHAEALRTYDRFRRLLSDEIGLEPSPVLQQLQERVLLHDPRIGAAGSTVTPIHAHARNPYKGLRPFTEADAADYFGRERAVDQLLARLRGGDRFLALVGASGSGKSSLVAAGLIPRIRAGDLPSRQPWRVVRIVPGSDPTEDLRDALGHPTTRAATNDRTPIAPVPDDVPTMVVIDQLEQLFSVSRLAARDEFLAVLAGLASSDGPGPMVVVTLRADHYDRPLEHRAFARVFTAGVVNLVPMAVQDLESAIVGPAVAVGAHVEPGLLAQLVADTVNRPGTLPLLQHTLAELFDRRAGPALTLADYHELGGLQAALSRQAEDLYTGLDGHQREAAMQVFLRLVTAVEGSPAGSRRVPLAELTGLDLDPVALSHVLDVFGRHRLLSFDRDPRTGGGTVELAHEALLSAWERLAGWGDRHRTALRRRGSLTHAVEEWEGSGRDPGYLLTGPRLEDLGACAEDVLELTAGERRLIDASRGYREDQRVREVQEAETARQRTRRWRWWFGGLVSALVVLAVALVSLWQAASPPTQLGYLHPGTTGLFDLAERGVARATSEFGLVAQDVQVGEEDPREVLAAMSAAGKDLIVVTDPEVDVAAVAPDHPETHYVAPYSEGLDLPNVTTFEFADDQAAHLVGAAAALTSTTGTIGFVGGVDTLSVRAMADGFTAGARAIDPGIEILVTWLSRLPDYDGFNNPPAAATAARHMYEQGADVVLPAAGLSQYGAFQAALDVSAETGRHHWVIGVDTDAYLDWEWQRTPTSRDHVLTSLIKRFDMALYGTIRAHEEGTLEPGAWAMDLSNDGVGISYEGGHLEPHRQELEAIQRDLINGRVTGF